MNTLKRFLKIGAVLLLIACGAVVYVWSQLQSIGFRSDTVDTVADTAARARDMIGDVTPTSGDLEVPTTSTGSQTSIKASQLPLSASQREMAENFGINLDTLVITPAMQTCAEGKVGAARYKEILGGSTPGVTEAFSLFGCLSAE